MFNRANKHRGFSAVVDAVDFSPNTAGAELECGQGSREAEFFFCFSKKCGLVSGPIRVAVDQFD